MPPKREKRKLASPSPEVLPPTKRTRTKRRDIYAPSSKYCSECNRSYGSERAHRAVCTRKQVSCVYPDRNSEGRGQTVVLQRVDGMFKCIRCGKALKKDQNMKAHARECLDTTGIMGMEAEMSGMPASSPTANPHDLAPSTTAGPADFEPSMASDNSWYLEEQTPAEREPTPCPVTPPGADAALPPTSPGPGISVEQPRPGPSTADQRRHPSSSPIATEAVHNPEHHSTWHRAKTLPGPALGEASATPVVAHSGSADVSLRASASSHHSIGPSPAPTPLNKHELRVVPDEHSIVDDPLLKCTPYIVNILYMVLICADCRHSVVADGASRHLSKVHPHCKVGTAFSEQLGMKFPGLADEATHPPTIVEAVFGLAIPIEKYTICARCRRGYANVATWQRHVCRNANANLAGQHPHFRSHVQTFFRGRKTCYFPVELPAPVSDEDNGDDFDLFKATFQEPAASEDEIYEPEDYRELNQFLLKEGWIKHVSGFSPSGLSLLIAPPGDGDMLKPVARIVTTLLSNIQAAIGAAGYHVRRLLGKRPADNHDGVRIVAHRDVQPECLAKYSFAVTCLITFVFRCFEGWEYSYPMTLTPAQEQACRRLKDILVGHAANDVEDDMGLGGDMDLWSNDNVQGDLDEEAEDDEDLDEEEHLDEEKLGTEVRSDLAENPLQRCVLDVLISLFTHLPSGPDDKFYSPIYRFIVLFSLQKNGQWLPGRRISELFSAFLFCGREIMMALMHHEVMGCSGQRYSDVYGLVSPFLDDTREGPMPSMYLVVRYLNHFSSAEEGTLRFTALDFSGDNIIVAGQVLYLRDIRYFVETIISEVKELICGHLFFGLDVFDVNWYPGVVHEEPRNRTVGYSCFRDPSNSFRQHRFDVLQAILTHPSLRGRFHFVSKDRKIVWKAGPCFAYMATCHNVEMLLFCGTQTSVGEPARASEIASHLIDNVAGGTIRNVLVMFQYLCMMGTFNKTSSLTGRDATMMRVPHPEIGRLWMLYLTFVRPAIELWQNYFTGRKAAARARNRLFFGPYRPVTPPELSRNLSRHTKRLFGIRIPISLWRHIATWFLNYNSIQFREYHTLMNRSALATQSGHSDRIHTLYAGDVRLPAGIDFHVFFDTMRTSGIWHRLVGFSNFSRPSLLEGMSHMLCERNHALPVVQPASEDSVSVPFAADVAEEVKRTIFPDILQAVSQSRANDLACLLDSVGMNLQSPPSRTLMQVVTHMMHPSRLRDLRTFLNDNSASFKDPQQALALELIRAKEPSLLVVGPTGSGKTLPIFMCIGLYDGGATTILILPLVAMLDEYIFSAQRYGLTCKTWTTECDVATAPQLLLVAVENCSWPELLAHISSLIRLGRLTRIVVHEAHLLVKHESFSPCLRMLRTLSISLVLVTPTWPVCLENDLFRELGRKVYQVVRRSTDRPETSQEMISIRADRGDFEQVVAKKIITTISFSQDAKRALLFCNSGGECDRMARLLGWRPYHSSMAIEERLEAMKLWRDGAVSGLACTLMSKYHDHSCVSHVFHLGAPTDVVDYYEAMNWAARGGCVGKSIVYFDPASLEMPVGLSGNDPFGKQVMYDMLHDTSLCRRLRPGFFLDGIGVPCAMLPFAQLCDICTAQLSHQRTDPGLLRIPHNLAPTLPSRQVDIIQPRRPAEEQMQPADLPNSSNQPAPLARFATHLSGWVSGTARATRAEELRFIRIACDNLAKSCVICWSNGFDYHSHPLAECRRRPLGLHGEIWTKWISTLRLPIGCCFFCGCPQKMVFVSDSGEKCRVHEHPSDQNCHWISVFKPLAFLAFHNPVLIQSLSQSSYGKGMELDVMGETEYVQWLCREGNGEFLNLLNVLLHVCELRGIPNPPL